jgi:phosphatidylserine/phosphatidylglycerophosphate/cardiolipin synthase-like enzyme
MELLETVFSFTSAKRRTVVLRPNSRGERPWEAQLPKLCRQAVQVKEYWHEIATHGERRIETFHAKLILADNRIAYVGSSNFLTSSLDHSLECGVLLTGSEVSVVTALVNAIEMVSRRIA